MSISRVHDGGPSVAVTESKSVANLVNRYLEEVRTVATTDGPFLVVVEVNVALDSRSRSESVGQNSSGSVEGVAVGGVPSALEPDLDVSLKMKVRLYEDIDEEGHLDGMLDSYLSI